MTGPNPKQQVLIAAHRDSGWGWLIEKGFDILQTDFTAQLRRYLRERG